MNLMTDLEHHYEREGPGPLVRAFFYVLRHLLKEKGFRESYEHSTPGGPDSYGFVRDEDRITVEMRSSGPGVLVITVESTVPLRPILREALGAYLEGIRVLLNVDPGL